MKRSAARQPAARQRCQPVTAAFLEWRLCSLQAPPPEWLTRDRIQEVPALPAPLQWWREWPSDLASALSAWCWASQERLDPAGNALSDTAWLTPGQEGQLAAGSPLLGDGLPSLSPKGNRELPAPLETCLCSWKTCSRQLTKLTRAPKGDSGMMKSSPGRGQAAWPTQGPAASRMDQSKAHSLVT